MGPPIDPLPASFPAMNGVALLGTGSYLPERVLDNIEAATLAGVTPAWIERRTGIRERRVAAAGEGTVAMGTRASLIALTAAGLDAADVDVIIVATTTPDHLTPPTACEIQARLGATRAAAFDIEAGFAGWLYAVILAESLLRAGTSRTALVVGAEKLSTVTNRSDPATGPLFGDAAGAAVLGAAGPAVGHGAVPRLVVRATSWWADGRLAGALLRPSGGAREPFDANVLDTRSHLLRMEGTRLFRHAVRAMAEQARNVCDQAGISISQIACVVPHQANRRILSAVASELGLNVNQMFVNIDRCGNTGSATVPVALDEVLRTRGAPPSPMLLVSFGAGATAGAALLESQ
jgi:3-oxoacyl-[acyl-carrier-protein] synthase III